MTMVCIDLLLFLFQTPIASHEVMLISKLPCKDLFRLLYYIMRGMDTSHVINYVLTQYSQNTTKQTKQFIKQTIYVEIGLRM